MQIRLNGMVASFMHDSEQFTRLWTQAHGAAAGFISAMVPNHAQADDLLQDVAVTAIRKFATFDPGKGTFTAWVLGIARIEVLEYRRRSATRGLDPAVAELLAQRCESIGPEVSRMRRALDTCMESVRGKSREITRRHYESGTKLDAIAADMRLSNSAVRTALHRVREQLRVCIEKRLRMPSGGTE